MQYIDFIFLIYIYFILTSFNSKCNSKETENGQQKSYHDCPCPRHEDQWYNYGIKCPLLQDAGMTKLLSQQQPGMYLGKLALFVGTGYKFYGAREI